MTAAVAELYFDARFTPKALTFSETAARQHIDNTIPDALMANASRLSEVLAFLDDECRVEFGSGLTVTSGYRCPRLNSAVGGAANSDHLVALAADLVVAHIPVFELAQFIQGRLALAGRPFNQIIIEFGRWVHLGLAREGRVPANETLTAQRTPNAQGKLITVYTRGLKESA